MNVQIVIRGRQFNVRTLDDGEAIKKAAQELIKDKELLGEVFVCQKIVEQNAIDHSQTVENETLRVLCHALFHLCGYKDKSSKDLAAIRLAEDKAIAAFHSTYK